MEEEKNEFEELNNTETETTTEQEIQDTESLVSNQEGQEFDFTNMPDNVKAPERIDLNGKEITITDVKLILPLKSEQWTIPKNKSPNVYKPCKLKVFYSEGGQQEYYSGSKVFKNDDGTYTLPTIHTDRNSQASELLGKYADFKKKDIKEISLKEFLGFLASKPKAMIEAQEFNNPNTNQPVKKNMIGKFL